MCILSKCAAALLASILLALAPASASQRDDLFVTVPGKGLWTPIEAPPEALGLDPFYTKYLDAGGIPVTGSNKVSDLALLMARDLIIEMLAHRPDLHRALVSRGQRAVIMDVREGTLDLPEQRDWKKPAPDDNRLTYCERKHYDEWIGRLTDAQYWNLRARGMGGVMTSGGAEGVLGLPTSRYYGQNIFVHEFAHGILDAVEIADPTLYAEVQKAYRKAIAKGLWKGEYASTTIQEYWAVGTQFWFNTAKAARIDGRTILSHRHLAVYDPRLYRLLGAVYGLKHRLKADVYYKHPARVPQGPLPQSTAEAC